MTPLELRNQLSGVIAFPITPFNDDLSLDLEGLRANLSLLLNNARLAAQIATAMHMTEKRRQA